MPGGIEGCQDARREPDLPPEQPRDQLPRDVFLTLVAQYWFDASPDAPGRWLFHLDPS